MFYSAITTIQPPTACVEKLVLHLNESSGHLVVAGDKKGPATFETGTDASTVHFLSLEDQLASGFSLCEQLPTGHYARKNIAYLQAMRAGASCIYETDDDNAPNSTWQTRSETIDTVRQVQLEEPGWVNVYRFFTDQNIWPRGLPLDEIRSPVPEAVIAPAPVRAPIQQGLVNGSPDVDAIWRLVMDRPFDFENNQSVYLAPGAWCPFNTQSTWWWPLAFPLMYVPSYCSFRMCDIWKSFVAQRCLWPMGFGVVFHPPEVDQDRNVHDLQRDFDDEVPGYLNNRQIASLLDGLSLDLSPAAVSDNLVACYSALVEHELFPQKELELVHAWVNDVAATKKTQ